MKDITNSYLGLIVAFPFANLCSPSSDLRTGHAEATGPKQQCIGKKHLETIVLSHGTHLTPAGAVAVEIALLLESWGYEVGLVLVSCKWKCQHTLLFFQSSRISILGALEHFKPDYFATLSRVSFFTPACTS